MIVKDEAANLPRCLASVRGVADEVVVVDTGSRDGTPDLARQLGARVSSFPWTGDFAAARNASLELATGDWVLYLDADEELVGGEAVREAVEDPGDREGYFLTVVSFVGDDVPGPDAVSHPSMRLFRNRPSHRFSGAVHEQVAAAVLASGPAGWCRARVHHYGYLRKAVVAAGKAFRNLRILERVVAEDPEDPFHRFNLGVEYVRFGRWEDALGQFRAAFLRLPPGMEAAYAPLLLKNIVLCLRELGRYDEALAVLRDAEPAYPDYTDLAYARGAVLLRAGCFTEAARAFRECLLRGESGPQHVTEVGVGGYRAMLGLGEALWKLGRRAEAAEAFAAAARAAPGHPGPASCLAELMLDAGLPPEAVLEAVRPLASGGEAARALAGVFLRRKLPECALAVEGAGAVARARALWQRGDAAGAASALEGECDPAAVWFRGVCLAVSGDAAGAEEAFARVSDALPDHAAAGRWLLGGPPGGAMADLGALLAEGGLAELAASALGCVGDPVERAEAFARAGMMAEAAAACAEAAASGRRIPAGVLDRLARAAQDAGMAAEAAEVARAAWEAEPSPARAARLAVLLAAAGDAEGAVEAARRGLELFPHAEVLELAMAAARAAAAVGSRAGKE